MTERMSVDVDAVRALAGALADAADRVGHTDPASVIEAAGAALPLSDSESALAELGPRARRAVRGTVHRLTTMSMTATRTADEYTDADVATAARLGSLS